MAKKPWMTVSEAVQSLRKDIGADLQEADIYRFVLSGDLVLSVRFIDGAKARAGKIVPPTEFGIRTDHYYEDLPEEVTAGKNVPARDILMFEQEIVSLEGIYDLLMYGDGRKLIEGECSKALDIDNTLLFTGSGILVKNWRTGEIFELVHKLDQATIDKDIEWHKEKGIKFREFRSYVPSGTLPRYNCHLCLRSKSLDTLIDSLSTKTRQDPLSIEIVNIVEGLKESGSDPSTGVVWGKLVETIDPKGSCCIDLEVIGNEDKIVFKSANGTLNRLNRASLANRLSRLKKS